MGNYKESTSIKDIIPNVLMKKEFKDYINIKIISRNWNSIMGDKLANITKPKTIKDSVLYIMCKHSGFIQSLMFQKKNILKEIYNYVNENEIKNVVFLFEDFFENV